MSTDLSTGPDAFIAGVERALHAGDPVRLDVPGGRLHIDRPLPFLCVYRAGEGTTWGAGLVHGQGSYLVVDDSQCSDAVAKLVESIVDLLAEQFGSVLLVEVWVVPAADEDRATYRIVIPDHDVPAAVDVLASSLERVDARGRMAQVKVDTDGTVAPGGHAPLLTPEAARALGCLHVGLAVPATFVDVASGRVYPLDLRALQADLAQALRKALFAFTQQQTAFPAEDYRALGRQIMVDAVAEADLKMAELGASLDFLLAITPVNVEQQWQAFEASGFDAEPAFHYRPLAVDPDLYRRDLYALRVEDVEDPTLAALLRAKRRDLERRVSMLEERGTPSFLYSSMAVYGAVEPELLTTARAVLQRLPREQSESSVARITAREFAALAEAEMARYRAVHPDLAAQVFVRDDVPDVMVVSGDLLIGAGLRLPKVRAEALLQHEVGTHTVTDVNGRRQPLRMLAVGLPGYEETQEGLAVLAEYAAGGLTAGRLATLAARVLATRCVTDGGTFVDTFRLLHGDLGLPPRRSFRVAMRVHRAGGFTKDAMYLRGFAAVLRHLGTGGTLEPLLVGKISLADVPIVEELLWRGVLSPAAVRPRWLDLQTSRSRLDAVRQGLTVLDIAEGIAA